MGHASLHIEYNQVHVLCLLGNRTRTVTRLDGAETEFTIKNLEPSTKYFVTIVAGNDDVGEGEATKTEITTDQKPGKLNHQGLLDVLFFSGLGSTCIDKVA